MSEVQESSESMLMTFAYVITLNDDAVSGRNPRGMYEGGKVRGPGQVDEWL